MIRAKQAGMPMATTKPVAGGDRNVIDLMEALRRSLGGSPKSAAPAKPASAAKPKKPRKRIEGQGEMLLPISGKGPPKAAAQTPAPAAKPSRASTGRKAG